MYAEHRYAPRQPRTISLGAAFLINGALIAGLVWSAPNILSHPPRTFEATNIPLPPVPPIEKPKELPKVERAISRAPLPHVPDPIVESPTKETIEGTDRIYPPLPPLPPAASGGTAITEPPPLPVLLAAEQDPRFAKDFQPAYPAAELRAQRDGAVRIRVLIGIDGRVKAAESVSATSPAFFEATRRQALAKWRFKPATRGGVPQESWETMNVRFELTNQ